MDPYCQVLYGKILCPFLKLVIQDNRRWCVSFEPNTPVVQFYDLSSTLTCHFSLDFILILIPSIVIVRFSHTFTELLLTPAKELSSFLGLIVTGWGKVCPFIIYGLCVKKTHGHRGNGRKPQVSGETEAKFVVCLYLTHMVMWLLNKGSAVDRRILVVISRRRFHYEMLTCG